MFVTGDAKVLENGVLTPFTSVFFSLKNRQPSTMFLSEIVTDKTGGGGECLQGNLWYSPPASLTSRLASVTFKMASKVFFELTDKNFDFITEILFRFLGFGDFKVPTVIEN